MFRRYSLLTLLLTFSIATAFIFLLVVVINLSVLRDDMLNERKSRLVGIIEKTEAIFTTYDTYYQAGVLSLDQAQAQALNRIRSLDDNYIFVINDNYILLASLKDKAELNSSVKYYKDIFGAYIYQDMMNKVKLNADGSFFSYYFPSVEGGKAKRKISYSKYFSAWGWTYGLGIYVDDIDDVISTTLSSFDELVI